MPNSPNTLAIGNAIVTYMSALTYPGTNTVVYTLAQLEAIKDVVDLVANGGVCCEVYGDKDSSQRRGFGGRIWDPQTWFILSLCALDTSTHAQQIYNVRDALVVPFQTHATLGAQVSNLFHAQLIEGSGKFFRVQRSGQWLRAHLIELETRQEWQVQGGIQS
jgi:hypothetical protein